MHTPPWAEWVPRFTAQCPWCRHWVAVDRPQFVVLSCTPNLTPYSKPDQTTKVVGHTHGIGKPQLGVISL